MTKHVSSLSIDDKIAILKALGFKVREGYIFDESTSEWVARPRTQEERGDALVLTWHEETDELETFRT